MVAFQDAYRDATSYVEAAADRLEALRRADLATVPTGYASLFVRRTARIAFGVTGTTAAGLIALAMIAQLGNYARLLVAAWIAALAAYPIAVAAAAIVLRQRLGRVIVRTGDPFRDLASLRVADPRAIEQRLAGARAHASYAWPLVAITLLAPHMLHLAVAMLDGGPPPGRDFDEWMVFTGVLTIHVFAYGVVTAWRFPRTRSVGAPIVYASLLSLVPGILLIGIPSVIVLLTAGVIGVVAYRPMGALIDREARSSAP